MGHGPSSQHDEKSTRHVYQSLQDAVISPFLKDGYVMEEFERALTEHGAGYCARENGRKYPWLNFLAFGAHVQRTKAALAAGADPNEADDDGITALLAAIDGWRFSKDSERGKRMVRRKGETPGGSDRFYLHVVRSLLAAAADPHLEDASGRSPWLFAVQLSAGPLIRLMVRYGAQTQTTGLLQVPLALEHHVRQGLLQRASLLTVTELSEALDVVGFCSERALALLIHEYAVRPLSIDGAECVCAACEESNELNAVVVHIQATQIVVGFSGEELPRSLLSPRLNLQGASFLCACMDQAVSALGTNVGLHPLFVSFEAPSDEERKQWNVDITAHAFDELGARVFCTYIAPALSLYTAGVTTGIVLTADEHLSVMPIYEGYALPHAMQRSETGGFPAMLQKLGEEAPSLSDEEVSLLRKKDDFKWATRSTIEETEFVESKYATALGLAKAELLQRCVSLVSTAIAQCDVDIRKELWGKILVAGMLRSFVDPAELKGACDHSSGEPQASVQTAELQSEWVGGSILTSLSTSCGMWISAFEYEESGPAIVGRKCF